MISLDTNILARFLLNDTPVQAAAAERLLSGNEKCTAPVTVFLELAWVLESCGCTRAEIADAIRLICGLENFLKAGYHSLSDIPLMQQTPPAVQNSFELDAHCRILPGAASSNLLERVWTTILNRLGWRRWRSASA